MLVYISTDVYTVRVVRNVHTRNTDACTVLVTLYHTVSRVKSAFTRYKVGSGGY
jgi:hypothetical protein